MMKLSVLLLVASVRARVFMEEGHSKGRGRWRKLGRSPGTKKIEMQLFIKQSNVNTLYETVARVSDPKSKYYGQHLSKSEIDELTAPKAEDIEKVVDFVQKAVPGAPIKLSSNGDVLTVTVLVSQAEEMLAAHYYEMKFRDTIIHRCPEGYSLPGEIAALVDFVTPTVHQPPSPRQFRSLEHDEARTSNKPETLRALYDIPDDVVGIDPSNSMAVTAFLGQYYSATALQLYYKEYCSELTCGKDGYPLLVGDATNGTAGVESMLDIETITGVAGNISSEFWGYSGNSPDNAENEPFTKWLTALANTSNPPWIFSTSYGEDESSWSLAAADRLNQEFAEVATRGISLLFASGDEGANCEDGDVFAPETPASSPFVTSVGGTTNRPEVAVSLSSGYFSNYWGIPDYQTDQVQTYLENASIPAGVSYNASGRAVPDISAQAANFCVTPFGCDIAGTSCASPTAAAIFALLNDLRFQNGKSSLGFLNYFIYQNVDAFNDITSGSSSGCGVQSGWPAISGWDAVTGVGTPNYSKLAAAVLELP